MNILHNPELVDRLAAAHAVGTLRGGARRRFETLARAQAPVRAAALIWQSRVASMNELQPATAPSPAVWTRIQNLVQADRAQATLPTSRASSERSPRTAMGNWVHSLAWWRGATAAGVLATGAAVVVALGLRDHLNQHIDTLQARLDAQPHIEYVAVLNDAQASAAMLVTFDPANRQLTLQRVGGYQEAADKSLQLWALPQTGGPRSLGVLSPEKLLQLTAGVADVRQVPALAISLEPKGGVSGEGGPTGPVLFKGTLIQKML